MTFRLRTEFRNALRALAAVTVLASLLLISGGITDTRAEDSKTLLPGGASSLQETYGDWRVACVVHESARRCGLSQQQSQKNGQRVLAIEMLPADKGTAKGTLILPFGLRLSAGATLAIDGEPIEGAFSFSTCLPTGCLMPLALDHQAVERLNAGKKLAIDATANDTAAPLSLTVSLEGFTAAMARIRALLR